MATVPSVRRTWQVPKYGSIREDVLTWCRQQKDDGLDYLGAEPGFQQLEESIRIISGRCSDAVLEKQGKGYSRAQTNRLKRNLREMVNSLSDIRFTPGYHSDSNEAQDKAELLNRVAYSWYVSEFIDVKIKQAVQWSAICPRGWLEPCYRTVPGKHSKKVVDVIPHSAFDVVMTGVPENGDHQEAYTVTIIKDVPMYLAHALFPEFQSILKPDRETPRGWAERAKDIAKSVVQDVFGTTPERETAKNPTCRIYYQYILDLSLNDSGSTMYMGYLKDRFGEDKIVNGQRVKTPWCYDVPSVGMAVPTGYDEHNTPVFRMATEDDARIFPGRRLVIFTEMQVLYDGPMFDWHGMVPLVKIVADSWPFAEFSMVHDVAPIHDTVQEIERICHQTLRNRFDPTLMYNMRAVPRDQGKNIRADIQGQRIGYNGSEGTGENVVRPLLPAGFNTIEEWVAVFKKDLTDAEDYQMGVRDISALSKLRVGASSDSMEKLMELAGPIVKGISRDMERSMRDLAEMFKYLVFQYYTTPQVMRIVGPDGITPENFDFDPGNLVPSHLPGEKVDTPSVYTKMKRAQWMAEHLPFMVTPNTLHEIVQTQQKLVYLQLFRMGFPISPWRLADVLHIANFGKVPDGANTEIEKWMAWQKMMLEFKASLSREAQELMGDMANAGAGQPASNTPGMGPKGGAKGSGGRAPSGQAMPQAAQKGDGRPYVRESK